ISATAAGRAGLIGRLILLDCTAYPQEPPLFFRLLRPPLMGRFLMAAVPLRLMVVANLTFVYHDRRTMTEARVKRYMTCFSRKGTAAAFAATARQLDPSAYAEFTANYRALTIPTLVIWGENDRVVPLAHGRRLAAEVPGARLVVIPSCGHNPHEERAAETFAAISSFLAATR
ncbi:MAG TPA: alpha/beta hydrolase, partial [Geobacteraceae bacterium]